MWNPVQDLKDTYKLEIQRLFVCSGKNGYTPTYEPAVRANVEPQYGCMQPSKNLRHRFLLLVRLSLFSPTESQRGTDGKLQFFLIFSPKFTGSLGPEPCGQKCGKYRLPSRFCREEQQVSQHEEEAVRHGWIQFQDGSALWGACQKTCRFDGSISRMKFPARFCEIKKKFFQHGFCFEKCHFSKIKNNRNQNSFPISFSIE